MSLLHAPLLFALALPIGEHKGIAYSRLTDGFWQIATMEADGSGEVVWTKSPSDKRHPAWSAHGDFLLFCDQAGSLFRIDAPEEEPRRVLAEQSPIAEPALSSEDHLTYMKVRRMPAYLLEVWTSNLNGSNPHLVTPQPLRQLSPAWSPDGRQIVVSQFDSSTKASALVVSNPDGTAPRTVIAGTERMSSPSWSPDGKTIAFAREERGEYDIWTVDVTGQGLHRLTSEPGLDTTPRFSPDGSQLVFVSRRSGAIQLWSVPTVGGTARRISQDDAPAREPDWFAPVPAPLVHLGAVEVPLRTLDLEARKPLEVRFQLDHPAQVDLEVLDENETVVRTVSSKKALEPGNQVVTWDGRDDAGADAKPGVHLLRLVYRGDDGVANWYPTAETGGTQLDATDPSLDVANRRAQFTLVAPSWVRVRVGMDKGPLISTIADWRPMPAGRTYVDFEGSMPAPWGSFWDAADRAIWVSSYAMPDNAVVVLGKGGARALPQGRPNLFANTKRDLFPHARHTRAACHDPQIQLRATSGTQEAGTTVVADELSFTIDTSNSADRAQFETGRFEVSAYMDGQFLFEDEDSALPFNFRFDVGSYSEGPHALLVNVASDQDHIGASFLPFTVKRVGR